MAPRKNPAAVSLGRRGGAAKSAAKAAAARENRRRRRSCGPLLPTREPPAARRASRDFISELVDRRHREPAEGGVAVDQHDSVATNMCNLVQNSAPSAIQAPSALRATNRPRSAG
jgi:hypothetical protein